MSDESTASSTGRSKKGRFTRTQDTAERDAEACRLYARGRTQKQVAEQLGFADESGVSRAISRSLKATVQQPADEVRRVMLAQLDELASAAFAVLEDNHFLVADGRLVQETNGVGEKLPLSDPEPVLKAIDRLLKIQERRAKLLGVDAPSKARVEVVNSDAVDEAIQALEKQLAANDDESPLPVEG